MPFNHSNSRLQANVRNYYMQFEETQTQDEIDSKIKEFEERSRGAFAAQVGAPAQSCRSLSCCVFQMTCLETTSRLLGASRAHW